MIEVVRGERDGGGKGNALPFAIGNGWYVGGVAEVFGEVEGLREVGRADQGEAISDGWVGLSCCKV